ncbi:MAG: hypothetical protein ACI9S9_004656 [Planctomycetota bacterium]
MPLQASSSVLLDDCVDDSRNRLARRNDGGRQRRPGTLCAPTQLPGK